MSKGKVVAASVIVLMVVSACSSGSSSESSPAAGSASAGPAGLVSSYKDAQKAVIQIVADGEYVDPVTGQSTQKSGAGSGFIIDPSGIAVTNAHVVEGAGSIKVYVGGDTNAINARILGVSECNDLAVIDLAGDQFPFVRWYTGKPELGTNVWAAGFPLGDPQYTLVDGSIAKNNADGNTSWASLDYSLQATAQIQPGNSGGPLLMEDGSVIGVNYMNNDVTNTTQFFAIPEAIAAPVVEILRTGQDQDSIGINGEAFYNEENSLAGVWVFGVRSGSPASNTGVKPGDVIVQMEGRDVVKQAEITAYGPTKVGYCDVLRTKGADSAIRLQIFRPSTGEVLEGEVNNPQKPLVAISTINNDSAGQTGGDGTTTDASVSYTNVTDDTDAISVDLPDEWSEVITKPGDGYVGISASTNISDWIDGKASGVGYYLIDGSLTDAEIADLIDDITADDPIIPTCKDNEAGEVTEGEGYTFVGNSYWSCSGTDSSYYVSIRSYPEQEKHVVLFGVFTTDQEVEFLNRSLASLVVA